MKLSKLYSNKPFHNITFIIEKGGMNVIIGDAKSLREGANSHSLGKSKLIDLLDFMLLKGIGKKNDFFLTGLKKIENNKQPFFDKNGVINYKTFSLEDSKNLLFEDYEFFLEILLNNGNYLTINRSVNTNSKIFFKINNMPTTGYPLYDSWDKSLAFDKAKEYLNDLLDFDFCKTNDESYRRLVNYSLRSQNDYNPKLNTIFQLSKFSNKNDVSSWKPLMFSLLGFNGSILKHKYQLEENIKKQSQAIREQEKDFGVKSEDKDVLVGKIQIKELEKELLTRDLENLNFYEQDKETIKNLVGTIEEDIASLNTYLYNIEYDINKLRQSVKNEFSFDLDRVKSLFEEVQIHFPGQLAKNYEQLIEFNSKITQERNSQIQKTLKEKEQEERDINLKLIDLNNQREKYRSLIQDTSLFKRYSEYQIKLLGLERELTRLQVQLEAVIAIEQKKDDIEDTRKNDLEDSQDQIKEIIENTASNILYMSIRKTFSELVKRILNETALITIKPNSNYNLEFKPEFQQSAQDEGNTYYKMLCIAFDLAILINYRHESYFRFVYHDDAIADYDPRLKPRLIQVIREVCLKHDIQYIFSAIKGNIPPTEDLSENIILTLHDKDDHGKLFYMSF